MHATKKLIDFEKKICLSQGRKMPRTPVSKKFAFSPANIFNFMARTTKFAVAFCILFIIITHKVVRGFFLAKADVMRASIFEYLK